MTAFSLSFDPQSLKEIVAFAGFPVLMSLEVQAAMEAASDLLIASIQRNMHWVNPTGALESSIQKLVDSPYEMEIGSPLAYARRREFGFTDMVDRLGRYYPYDPGGHYMEAAMYESGGVARDLIFAAVQRALNQLAAGGSL